MKKLVIVTDGFTLRGFRLSDSRRGSDLSFHCTEIHSTCDNSDPDLGALADEIGELVAQEEVELWNLAAPRDLLNPLVCRLRPEIGQRLARTHVCNLVASSLTEIALRFPPTPSQPAPSLRPARRRKTAAGK